MKKLFTLGLTAAMVASLTACGGGSGNTTDTTAAGAENAASGTDGAADNNSASGEGTFKIGVIGPLTGPAAAYGIAVQNGADLAVKEINAAGGAGGIMLEANPQDDEHDPQKSVNAYNTLKDWGAQAIVGSTTSDPCIAVAAETSNDNMFQITPSGSAVECVAPDNVFRVCFADPDQGTASAVYIGENKLATKVAVIYDSSTTYSSGIREAFVKEAGTQGLEIVADEAFTADNATDFSVQLDKAKEAGAELVFLPIYYQEASVILKQASDKDFAPIFFGCDGMDGILAVEGFDVDLANNLMFMSPFTPTSEDEAIQKFVKDYEEAYGSTPNQFAADAYDGIYAIKAAMEEKDITPDMSPSDICDAMKEAMVNITIDGVTAKGLTWEASGEPSKEPMVVKIEDGDYAVVE